jgi:hypothetical protein
MRCDRDGGEVKLGCPRSATAAVFKREGDRGEDRTVWTRAVPISDQGRNRVIEIAVEK